MVFFLIFWFFFFFFLKAYRILIDVRSQLERLEMFSTTMKETSPYDMKSRFRQGFFFFFLGGGGGGIGIDFYFFFIFFFFFRL